MGGEAGAKREYLRRSRRFGCMGGQGGAESSFLLRLSGFGVREGYFLFKYKAKLGKKDRTCGELM